MLLHILFFNFRYLAFGVVLHKHEQLLRCEMDLVRVQWGTDPQLLRLALLCVHLLLFLELLVLWPGKSWEHAWCLPGGLNRGSVWAKVVLLQGVCRGSGTHFKPTETGAECVLGTRVEGCPKRHHTLHHGWEVHAAKMVHSHMRRMECHVLGGCLIC